MPIWLGPQLPCSGYPSRFSWNPATSYNGGYNQATQAYAATTALGFPSYVPIVYDLEGTENPISAACIDSAKSFIQGWVDYLRTPPAQSPGYYGPVCNPSLNNFATITTPPDFVWGADQNANPSTGTLSCTNSGYWTNGQRHKQYTGSHNETWGGVTMLIDNDCANGSMYTLPWPADNICL